MEQQPPSPSGPLPPADYSSLPPHGSVQPGRGGNAPAITSLVLGILGCVPLLTGILAVIFGIVGIRKTRDPRIGGKGLAIAGLVLGIVSIIGWLGLGGFFGHAYEESLPARGVAQQFLTDVSTGDIDAALANSNTLTAAQLQSFHTQLQPFGAVQAMNVTTFNYTVKTGRTVIHLDTVITFANGQHNCTFDLVKIGGVYKVTSAWVQ